MKKRANMILGLLFTFVLCLNIIQNYRVSELRQSLNEFDSRIATEFDGAKQLLSLEFQEHEYSPLLAMKIEKFKMAALYGYYLDGFSGGDAQWCILSQAIGELNNADIFQHLSDADCDMIARFLEEHEYQNSPEITEEDISPILERIEIILQEYTTS